MLATIDLDDEFGLQAEEIYDVGSKNLLTSKLDPLESRARNRLHKHRSASVEFFRSARAPSPPPSPAGRGSKPWRTYLAATPR